MKKSILNILSIKNYFKPSNNKNQEFSYYLEKPGQMLLNNICINWLKFIQFKTQKNVVYTKSEYIKNSKTLPYGFITYNVPELNNEILLEFNNDLVLQSSHKIEFNLVVPELQMMLYFIQWQRHRKYWWSSITTIPGLFVLSDVKSTNDLTELNIFAKFPNAEKIVENISAKHNVHEKTFNFNCTFSIEDALLTLLLDGLTNTTKEKYLRLHRNVTPYKIAFAINMESTSKEDLKDLATLLHNKLKSKHVSSWIPDFVLPLDLQVTENLELGVVYTAIISEATLSNGILHLMNSSSMVKEQVHVADFDSYVSVLCQPQKFN